MKTAMCGAAISSCLMNRGDSCKTKLDNRYFGVEQYGKNLSDKDRKQKTCFSAIKDARFHHFRIGYDYHDSCVSIVYFEKHDFFDINEIDKKEFSCYWGDLEIRGTVFVPSD